MGLLPEEVEELEADLHLIPQLILSTIAEELARWNGDEDVELDEAIVIGRFLSWLCLLNIRCKEPGRNDILRAIYSCWKACS